jgi:hypothetical protein
MNGARRGSRTPDILITNQVLYQLSYAGIKQFQTCRPWRRIMLSLNTGLAIRGSALGGARVH